MDETLWAVGMDALYLAGCALHGETPVLPEDYDYAPLFRFCQHHTVTAIVAMALDTLWQTHPAKEAQMHLWRQARDHAIRKNLLLNTERKAILAHLEAIGCWYMPLKGSVLQQDYPKFGMRQMTDNDILIDPAKRETIHDFLIARGYTTGFYLQNEVDTYQKPPVYNFEMHTTLFSKAEGEELARYYRDIRTRAVPDSQWGHHLSDEDFYIYMLAHAYKHWSNGGVGIRNLLDVHVFLGKHGDMDLDYVNQELDKLGISDFEALCRTLCRELLTGDARQAQLTPAQSRALATFFTSGTFGTREQKLAKKIRRLQKSDGKITFGAKLRFTLGRLFMPRELLRIDYPDIDRKPWKIPFYQLRRWVRCLLHPGKTFAELRQIRQVQEPEPQEDPHVSDIGG